MISTGDLVRVKNLDFKYNDDIYDKVGVVFDHDFINNFVEVHLLTGSTASLRLSDLEVMRYAPSNKEMLKILASIKDYPYQIFIDLNSAIFDIKTHMANNVIRMIHEPLPPLKNLCDEILKVHGDSLSKELVISKIYGDKDCRGKDIKLLSLHNKIFNGVLEDKRDDPHMREYWFYRTWWRAMNPSADKQKLWSILTKIRPKVSLISDSMKNKLKIASEEKFIDLYLKYDDEFHGSEGWSQKIEYTTHQDEFVKFANYESKPTVIITNKKDIIQAFLDVGSYAIDSSQDFMKILRDLENIKNGKKSN